MYNISGISSTVPTLAPRKEHQQVKEALPRSDDHAPKNKEGSFLGAINRALKATGLDNGLSATQTPSKSNAAVSDHLASASDEARIAMESFMQHLMGALQSENDTSRVFKVPPTHDGVVHQRPQLPHVIGFGGNDISDKLQRLVSRLNSNENETSGLALSFKRLVSALGGDDSEKTIDLTSFLSNLANRSAGQRNRGNFLDTQV